MIHFHANVHIPGYLPEGDVPRFDSATDAWDYLAGEIDRAWDGEFDAIFADTTEEERKLQRALSDRYESMQTLATKQTAPGWLHIDGDSPTHLGYIYEVTECAEECAEEE